MPTFFEAGSHALSYGLGVIVPVKVLVAPSPRQHYRVPVDAAHSQPEPDSGQNLSSKFSSQQTTQLWGHGNLQGERNRE